MREISFRAKRIDTMEWVYGFLSIDQISNHYYIEPFDLSESVRVLKKTVGEFSGITDDDGQRIYEGDILSPLNQTLKYKVEFSNGSFCVINNLGGENTSWGTLYKYKESCEKFKNKTMIIGNVYDNPELLSGSGV
jgi:uncharacterized phage protein (TIGR01671 family)